MARRIHLMHLNGPAEAESFMIREGVSPEGDDLPEWLDNERGPDFNPDEEADESDDENLDADDEDDYEETED